MATEDELEIWRKLEGKTGNLEPGSVLQLLLLSREELEVLMRHPKISKNQRKKVARRMKWLDETQKRKEKRNEKKKAGKMRSSRIRKEKIASTQDFEQNYHVAIDFGTGAEMRDSEKMDLAKQSKWCYQKYRRSGEIIQFYFFDVMNEQNDGLRQFFGMHSQGWEGWDMHRIATLEKYKDKGIMRKW